MNSTKEDVHVNLVLQDEASTSGNKQLPSPDNNANLNATSSKGAIPKTIQQKQQTSKRSVKINNNIEDMSIPLRDRHQQNGFVECIPPQVPSSYISDAGEKLWNCDKLENEDSQFLTLNDLKTFNVPLASQCDTFKDGYSDFSLYRRDCRPEDSSSDENELLSISDDGCIYTYKGDHVADLPSSFFSLDVPLQPSPDISAQNRQENNVSPEMDYLEMDFDPGPSGDLDSDTGSNIDLENTQNLPNDIETEICFGESSKNVVSEEKVEFVPKPEVETKTVTSESLSTPNKEKERNPNPEKTVIPEPPPIITPEIKPAKEPLSDQNAILAARIRKLKLPWLYSPYRHHLTSSNMNLKRRTTLVTEMMSSSSDFSYADDNERNKTVLKQGTSKSCNSSPNDQTTNPKMKKVMIWSEEEAYRKQISQIGVSACGATAVLNVLKALRFPVPPVDKIQSLVKTRLRENTSPLPEYLLSRSIAGCTHEDIINGLSKASNGEIYARFFHMYPDRDFDLCCFLRFWIKNGAVPIASLNLQKCIGNNGNIPDAWHHQMVFGIGPRGVYLTNPLEYVDVSQLWPQLCSESILLIKREDVLSRWNQETDLPKLMRIDHPAWRNLNVVGQVANMVRESRREFRQGFTNTSHIKIPAAYSSGITIALKRSNPTYPLLRFCVELPLNKPKNTEV